MLYLKGKRHIIQRENSLVWMYTMASSRCPLMIYFIKEANAAIVPRGTVALLNPFPFAIGALLTHLDFLCYSLKTTTY
jgi:hypothetical protein